MQVDVVVRVRGMYNRVKSKLILNHLQVNMWRWIPQNLKICTAMVGRKGHRRTAAVIPIRSNRYMTDTETERGTIQVGLIG